MIGGFHFWLTALLFSKKLSLPNKYKEKTGFTIKYGVM